MAHRRAFVCGMQERVIVMGKEDYTKAFKLGKKDYQMRMLRGVNPTLPVLDDILPEKGSYAERPIGLVQMQFVFWKLYADFTRKYRICDKVGEIEYKPY